ncbi:hypothetical protein JCM10914A_33880 [Paenibacillus sp. JCM 10914]|uniref:hypothetical protein n=1 Tax=Paenibacillus sp. JCM 10914 TaxID=1236974 RepID=UPI0003CC47B9|nr:hypothetical protein [Paenibacillus sp. JCM 10914]GAE04013.1 hypothetical protein JCM10914_36 [Paenibacillus sp. JCM 10914]
MTTTKAKRKRNRSMMNMVASLIGIFTYLHNYTLVSEWFAPEDLTEQYFTLKVILTLLYIHLLFSLYSLVRSVIVLYEHKQGIRSDDDELPI